MDDNEAVATLRLRIGDPSPQKVPPETLMPFWNAALERLANEIGWLIPEPLYINLQADEYSYPLPEDVLRILWVERNNTRLVPDGLTRWVRDGLNWRSSQAGTPGRFAVQGRLLLINPPPTADSTDRDTQLAVGYISHSPGLGPQGVVGLPDADLMVAVYDAAQEFLAMMPGVDEAAMKRSAMLIQSNAAFYARELQYCRVRWEKPAIMEQKTLSPSWRRSWAAR